jgi:signal transduction histidine kinase
MSILGASKRTTPNFLALPGKVILLTFFGLCGLAYTLIRAYQQSQGDVWISASVLLVCLVYLLMRLLAEMAALRRLEQSIHNAREGLLEPTPVDPFDQTYVGRLIPEYNTTISTLRSMFQTVEECQSRFLNEWNRGNTVLKSLPGALLSLDDNLQVSISNRQADTLFGVEEGCLIGANLFDLLDPNKRDRELLRDAFLYKYAIRNQEINLKVGDKERNFSLNLGFYSDEENDIGGVLILQDITDYRELMESVAMREKLVAMGQLAAGVAHELNTPLGNILGYAQLLERGVTDSPKLSGYARIISEEIQRCSRVVHELLGFARQDKCSDETCDVNQLVQELIETFVNCRLKRYQIEVRMDLEPGRLVVEGGCGQLDIVLTNLLINAIHALDKAPNPLIVIQTRYEGPYALISVADNGLGVPKDIRTRLFDPFFTTKPVGQGSGLGLSISNAIVAKRGGFIAYDNEYIDGARFVVKLPAVDLTRANS